MGLLIKYWLSKVFPLKNFLILSVGKEGQHYFYNISSSVFKGVRFVSVQKVRETSKTIICSYISVGIQYNTKVIAYLHLDKKQFYNQLKSLK